MLANQSMHRSESGKICTKCEDVLVAPEWSQHVDERRVFNLWSCAKCGSSFGDVSVFLPAGGEAKDENENRHVLQSRLVA